MFPESLRHYKIEIPRYSCHLLIGGCGDPGYPLDLLELVQLAERCHRHRLSAHIRVNLLGFPSHMRVAMMPVGALVLARLNQNVDDRGGIYLRFALRPRAISPPGAAFSLRCAIAPHRRVQLSAANKSL